MSSIVELCVHMDCQGCERKIKRALEKMEGVRGIEIDMERQKVMVTGSVKHEKVLKAVQKTGRKAVLWPYNNHHSNGNAFTNQEHNENQRNHPAIAPQNTESSYYEDVGHYSSSTPSYNYYTHGYSSGYGSYGHHYPPQPAALMYPVRVGQRAGDMFSDENPNACSIM